MPWSLHQRFRREFAAKFASWKSALITKRRVVDLQTEDRKGHCLHLRRTLPRSNRNL